MPNNQNDPTQPNGAPEQEFSPYALRPSELSDALKALIKAKRPVMVWGPPGVAKSSIARQTADDLDREYLDIRATLLDPVDLRGIPWRDSMNSTGTSVTRWAPPGFLPQVSETNPDQQWLINFDELPTAPPMVQVALYQLVLDRRCGEYHLPDGAALVACGNRLDDGAHARRMPTPLASRFVHLELKPDVEDWCSWGAANKVHPVVLFFMQFRPDMLFQFDAHSKQMQFPCPRTWEFVSDVVKDGGLTGDMERKVIAGTVGDAAAVEFHGFLQLYRQLPRPKDVLDKPSTVKIPKDHATVIALCGAVYRLVTKDTMDAVTTFAKRLRPELGAFLLDACVRKNPDLKRTTEYGRYMIEQTQLAAAVTS